MKSFGKSSVRKIKTCSVKRIVKNSFAWTGGSEWEKHFHVQPVIWYLTEICGFYLLHFYTEIHDIPQAYFAEVLFLYTVRHDGGLWGIVVGTYLNFLKMFWCTSRARTHIIAKVKKVFCNNHVIAIHLGGRWSHRRSELSHRANSPGRELEGNSTQANICQARQGCSIYMSQLGWYTC